MDQSRLTQSADLFIFDLDGTLLESAIDIAEAVDYTLAGLGYPRAGVGHVRGWIGDGATVLVARALHWGSGITPSAAQTATALKMFLGHYADCCCNHTTLTDGATQIFTVMQRLGIRAAVASNKPQAASCQILEHLGLANRIEVVIGGDTLPTRKPDAAPLMEAARRCGAKQPWMIGDSELDRCAALAAGFPFIGVRGGYVPAIKEQLAEASAREIIDVPLRRMAAALDTLSPGQVTFNALRAALARS